MTDTLNRPADEPGLDEMFQNHRLDIPYGKHMTKFDECDYCRAQLLRWHTAEVRATLERLKALPNIQGAPVHVEAIYKSAIDAELDKLKYDQD
jgi:hypothetical protein